MSIDKHFRVRHGLSVNTAGSNATVEIAANDAILVPRGNSTGDRPTTAANGMFRYNTTSGSFEGYIAGSWTALTDATTASDMETTTYDPAGVSEQLVGLTAVQTLTNKTLTSPTINTSINLPAGAINAITEIASGLKKPSRLVANIRRTCLSRCLSQPVDVVTQDNRVTHTIFRIKPTGRITC